jgi:hypothetical protein
VTGPIGWLPVLENVTGSPDTGLPRASVTLAVATEVEAPSAAIDAGLSSTRTLLGRALVWDRALAPVAPPAVGLLSVALICDTPGLVVEVTVA